MNSSFVASIERELRGFCKIQSLHIDLRPDLRYDLILGLEQKESGKILTAKLQDISNLRLESFGGGPMEFEALKIEDISDRQWDRIRFHISELEDEQFECNCAEVVIEE